MVYVSVVLTWHFTKTIPKRIIKLNPRNQRWKRLSHCKVVQKKSFFFFFLHKILIRRRWHSWGSNEVKWSSTLLQFSDELLKLNATGGLLKFLSLSLNLLDVTIFVGYWYEHSLKFLIILLLWYFCRLYMFFSHFDFCRFRKRVQIFISTFPSQAHLCKLKHYVN